VRHGAARPDIGSEAALREAVQAARSIGYSTGPSGTALLALFERWGIAGAMRARIVQAPPGVPVARLVAEGTVEMGFQQASELLGAPGVEVVGTLPAACAIETVFSGARCAGSRQPEAVAALLRFLRSPQTEQVKRRYGMAPA
jgi:molybdate transport system substrate-binding protein